MSDLTPSVEEQENAAPARPRRGLRWLFTSPAGLGMLAAVFVAFLVGGTWLVHYTESTAFCTTCHTMIPQEKAHAISAHEEVSCAECHVSPGITGYVKAKIGGIRELEALITNTYERPIKTPDRFDMPLTPVPGRAFTSSGAIPSAKDTCSACHPINKIDAAGQPTRLIVNRYFAADEANTAHYVAIRIRPSGLGSNAVDNSDLVTASNPSGVDGVHWHITQSVSIYNNEGANGPVPLVEVVTGAGKTVQFISSDQIGLWEKAGRDVQRLKAATARRAMDCVDCHNRVGHEIKSVESVVNNALEKGTISTALPWIKRHAVDVISTQYASDTVADTSIDAWAKRYAAANPTASKTLLTAATAEIKRIYHELDTPAMNTNSKSYLNNLGHASGPGTGCFRCHDGQHVKVVDGRATNQVIPSTCSTCHSFPMVAQTKIMLPNTTVPTSHKDDLYVFNHKADVASVAAAFSGNGTCATCHDRGSCETCHSSAIGKVKHVDMVFNHAKSVQAAGIAVCATCHQKETCARCHGTDVTDPIAQAQATVFSYIKDLS